MRMRYQHGLALDQAIKFAGPVKVDHFIAGSVKAGRAINRLRSSAGRTSRWNSTSTNPDSKNKLIQIQS
jgi:hypothetical protein